MSEQNNISPLLDGFTLGAPYSEHHGVACFPAIKDLSNKKYIVKKITVPASQQQFDALLFAGAYKDPGDAMEYFRENGERILAEAELLKKLSKIEGFLSYDEWQMEPITRRRLGYEIYLVSSYKRSLEKYMRKNPFTHLEAVNLALDLCSALSVCRQSGYLYVDLKPSNIFVSEKKEYRIGDLGFLSLDALRYASLPERYFSSYTPPELLDPMESMNLTVDTYAVGMILYQLYNDGHLPFTGFAPAEPLPSPCHADYELADIILKAIHPDPEERWTDPKDMGKAIASYMQRNSVNNIPITPFIPLDIDPEDIVPLPSRKKHKEESTVHTEDASHEEAASAIENAPPAEENAVQAIQEALPDNPDDSSVVENTDSAFEDSDAEESPAESSSASEEAVLPEEAVDFSILETEDTPDSGSLNSPEESAIIPPEPEPDTPLPQEPVIVKQDEDTVSFTEITEEVAKILSKANDIISHEIPKEAVFASEEEQPDPFAFVEEDAEECDDSFPAEPLLEELQEDSKPSKKKKAKHFENPSRKNKLRKFISSCFSLLMLCGACVAGYWYYQNLYLQNIDSISISGTQNQITVLVDTSIEESLLILHCTDESGNRKSVSVEGGKAEFTDLQPSTQYTVQVDMKGFHKLTGATSDVFTTEATTQILSFHTIAGPEDGSVKLDFTVNGNDPDFWNIRYSAEGEEELRETVTGHSAMISGLTVGKVYTFTLDGGRNFDVSGETSVQYLASKLILAEDLALSSSDGTNVTVHWNTPGDVVVENWNVRFYDGYGFEEQKTVTDNSLLLTGITPGTGYTVEVTASGMTQPAKINISAEPILLSDFHVDESSKTEMKITWKYTGKEPEGGWLLSYTVDGSGMQVVDCDKASAKITPLIPGADYEFHLQSADGRTVFNNIIQYHAEEADPFSDYAFIPENVSMELLKTPENADWLFETISDEAFTNTFRAGESASIGIQSSSAVYLPSYNTSALFVFRNSHGNVLPELVTEASLVWRNIWMRGDTKYGEIDIPALPSVPGTYIMDLYFNGRPVTQFDITIEN